MNSPSTRRAMVKAPYQFETRQETLPALKDGDLLIDIAACAICGTDLSIAGKLAKDWQPFGHEVSGIVRAVGAGVRDFQPGDRVALDSSAPCGACERCRAGAPLECTAVASYWGRYMGFADWLITPRQCAFPAGDLPPQVACLLEPLGVSVDLVSIAEVGPGDRVLLIGPGPLGLLAIPAAKAKGAAQIWVAGHSHSVARLEAAKQLGADAIIEVDQTDLRKFDFGPRGVNKVLVVAPPTEIPLALDLVAKGGIVAYIGISWGPAGKITIDADQMHFRRQQLRSSMASPGTRGPEALALLRSGRFDPNLVISHCFELADLPANMLRNRDDKATAKKLVMLNPANAWVKEQAK